MNTLNFLEVWDSLNHLYEAEKSSTQEYSVNTAPADERIDANLRLFGIGVDRVNNRLIIPSSLNSLSELTRGTAPKGSGIYAILYWPNTIKTLEDLEAINIENIDNGNNYKVGQIYFGKATGAMGIYDRLEAHKNHRLTKESHTLHLAISILGAENFIYKTVENLNDLDDDLTVLEITNKINELEKKWILGFNSLTKSGTGFNDTSGGNGGSVITLNTDTITEIQKELQKMDNSMVDIAESHNISVDIVKAINNGDGIYSFINRSITKNKFPIRSRAREAPHKKNRKNYIILQRVNNSADWKILTDDNDAPLLFKGATSAITYLQNNYNLQELKYGEVEQLRKNFLKKNGYMGYKLKPIESQTESDGKY